MSRLMATLALVLSLFLTTAPSASATRPAHNKITYVVGSNGSGYYVEYLNGNYRDFPPKGLYMKRCRKADYPRACRNRGQRAYRIFNRLSSAKG